MKSLAAGCGGTKPLGFRHHEAARRMKRLAAGYGGTKPVRPRHHEEVL
jgi:hypothetical protein